MWTRVCRREPAPTLAAVVALLARPHFPPVGDGCGGLYKCSGLKRSALHLREAGVRKHRLAEKCRQVPVPADLTPASSIMVSEHAEPPFPLERKALRVLALGLREGSSVGTRDRGPSGERSGRGPRLQGRARSVRQLTPGSLSHGPRTTCRQGTF